MSLQSVRPGRHVAALFSGCGVAIFALVAAPPTEAQTSSLQPASNAATTAVNANLNITPKRLTLDRGERSATVYIFNQGTSPAVFDISFVDRVMLPTGEIMPVAEAQKRADLVPLLAKLQPADGMLVATPRRANLAPGKGQTVRIWLKSPPQAGTAEYRSHLTVTTIPPRDVGVTAEEAAAAATSNKFSFQVTSIFGVSIPVIVRPGPADLRGSISNVRLSYADISRDGKSPPQRTPLLMLDINRLGANSLFGNVEVRERGSKVPIGIARGVGVYTEISSRTLSIPLQHAPRSSEPLEITFVDDDVNPGRAIARTTFVG